MPVLPALPDWSTSHPLSTFWLNPVCLWHSSWAPATFRKLSLVPPYAQPLLCFPSILSCLPHLSILGAKQSNVCSRGGVPLISASLDSVLVLGTNRCTMHVVELTCRCGDLEKGQGRRELGNFGLSKIVLQANKMGKVILGGKVNCIWQDKRQWWGKHGVFKESPVLGRKANSKR